jgi:hypothetical protein
MSRFRSFGWVRSIGATLTLVGVAIVVVVVILPTAAFGSAKAAKGGCKIAFKSFSNAKEFRPSDDSAGVVAIFGSNLDRVDQVYFGGPAEKQWIPAEEWDYHSSGQYITAEPADESVGVKGRIRIADFDPDPVCYALSNSQYTPLPG